ncbi:MAG: rhodanese-like domain-containing protein [Desulfosalsimonadaceae bacterium]|nr:rhodanese-like domain-containing protein [Desulfosalsimonadaceae bacterium]
MIECKLTNFKIRHGRTSTWPTIVLFTMTSLILVSTIPAWGFDLQRIGTSTAAAKQNQMVFLDARPLRNWQENHIPGAMSFSWETYTGTDAGGVKYRIFPPEKLAAALGKMGIRNTDTIVVYGDADSSWGGEGWLVWMLAWLGHQGPVYCLDGGFASWAADKQPVSKATEANRAPTVYALNVQPQVTISAKQIMARQKNINLIDTRSYLTEWLPGHIPGAIHIPWEKFYTGQHRRALSPEALKVLLIKHGVDLRKPVVYYCTGGIRSGYAWMVHELSGLPGAMNFEGGMEEWNAISRQSTAKSTAQD